MKWFVSLVMFAIAQSTFASVARTDNKTDPRPTCKDFQTESVELLGTWYEAQNEKVVCLTFELLTDQSRSKLATKLSLKSNAFENYSMILTQKCSDKEYNEKSVIHVWKKLEAEGKYKGVLIKNNTVKWGLYGVLAGKFSYQGKDYLGIIDHPGQRFIAFFDRDHQAYLEDGILDLLTTCFCKLSNVCLD